METYLVLTSSLMPSVRDMGRLHSSSPTIPICPSHSQRDSPGIVQAHSCLSGWLGQKTGVHQKCHVWWAQLSEDMYVICTGEHRFHWDLPVQTMTSSMQRSAYAHVYSSWTIAVTGVLHALSQVVSQEYWSLCHGCKTVCQDQSDEVYEQNWLTHGYLVDFSHKISVISQGIVFVEMGFAKYNEAQSAGESLRFWLCKEYAFLLLMAAILYGSCIIIPCIWYSEALWASVGGLQLYSY